MRIQSQPPRINDHTRSFQCYICHEQNHLANNCPQRHRIRSENQFVRKFQPNARNFSSSQISPSHIQAVPKVQCFYCEDWGHYQSSCPRKTKSFQKSTSHPASEHVINKRKQLHVHHISNSSQNESTLEKKPEIHYSGFQGPSTSREHASRHFQASTKTFDAVKQNYSTPAQSQFTPVCHQCGRIGHIRPNCKSKNTKIINVHASSDLPLPMVNIDFWNFTQAALLDTGSSSSLITEDFAHFLQSHCPKGSCIIKPTSLCTFSLANKGEVYARTELRVKIKLALFTWKWSFLVVPDLLFDVILGIDWIHHVGAILNYKASTLTFPFSNEVIPLFFENFHQFPAQLTLFQENTLQNLSSEFKDVLTPELGCSTTEPYHIVLNKQTVIRSKPYRVSPHLEPIFKSILQRLLHSGVISETTSPYASPAFLVPKKKLGDYRLVTDFRLINKLISVDPYPLPLVDDIFMKLGSATVYTVLDLNSAFNQISLHPDSRQYMAFVTPYGCYHYNRVPFGVNYGAQALNRALHKILQPLLGVCVIHYLDDVVVYSDTLEQHVNHLRQVLTLFRQYHLTVNPEKIEWATHKIHLLGYIVSHGNLMLDPERIRSVLAFPVPRNIKGVRRFLGLVSYYARFLPNLSDVVIPLNQLKCKGQAFVWEEQHNNAFQYVKQLLTSPPILILPRLDLPFILSVDASSVALGAVLQQSIDNKLLPVAYASRILSRAERRYSAYEREALACVWGCERFCHFLEGTEFELKTDNQALAWLWESRKQLGKLARWVERLSRFRFVLKHVSGSDNVVADSLSRMFDPAEFEVQEEESVDLAEDVIPTAIGAVNLLQNMPEAFVNLQKWQELDPEVVDLKEKIQNQQITYLAIKKGIVGKMLRSGKFVPFVPEKIKDMIFQYFHASYFGAHQGQERTCQRIAAQFWWPNMKEEIRRRVRECEVCQKSKSKTTRDLGKFSSEPPGYVWERVYLDIFGPLPRSSRGNVCVLVGVDAFSKFVFMIPLKDQRAESIVRALTERVFPFFGTPTYLVTDNATSFVSKQMQNMAYSCGIRLVQVTPYHPQANMVERYNKTLKAALIAFHHDNQKNWDTSMDLLTLALNSSLSEATGFSANKIFFGRDILHPLSNAWSLGVLDEVTTRPDQQAIWNEVTTKLHKYYRNMARIHDKRHNPPEYQLGDLVLMKTHHISKKVDRFSAKLSEVYEGPFKIKAFLTPVSLLLENPNTQKMLKCHVTNTKKYVAAASQ